MRAAARVLRLVPYFAFCLPFVAVGFVAGLAWGAVKAGRDHAEKFAEWV